MPRLITGYGDLYPRTPAFFAERTSNYTTGSGLTTIQLNNVVLDTTSGWDTTNYVWVVPISGKYLVSGAITATGTGWELIISKNGAQHTTFDQATYRSATHSIVMDLDKGNNISVQKYAGVGIGIRGRSDSGTYLSAILIG